MGEVCLEEKMKTILTTLFLFTIAFAVSNSNGEKIFKTYCWGCHHQTSEAFGPSFRYIASKRTEGEIIAQIVNPEETYKLLGYKRNSMPPFNDLSGNELKDIVDYIMKFKEK